MKLFASLVLVVLSTVAQASKQGAIAGPWVGDATVHGQQVPLRLEITGRGKNLQAALLNGPELNGPDRSPASSVSFVGNHLLITFNYYARTLDAIVADSHLTGTFGTSATRYPVTLSLHGSTGVEAKPDGPAIPGDWEVEVKSSKGESAWQLRIEPSAHSDQVKAVIQRIDGDTGALYGGWTGHEYLIGHFTAAGPALYSVTPQSDGTLLVSNKLRADVNEQQNLTARRPAQARAAALPGMTDPTQQTTVKDPSARFAFSFPDLTGKLVSNTDPQFDGKVVIVAIGGSWCPNCHDEAPMLESLYKQFHSQGLEVVNLSFEEADQLKEPTRLHAFIEKYGLTYTVLVAGETEQLNEKIPQGVNLNCWPTSFFLGRDGRVREVHAGFAGPANPPAHEALVKETTELVEKLLAEPVPAQSASLK
ncbi:TlpA disulfide reductase family protein [Tunturiibacter empetritectus]|uniref:Peroxiredoxin n=1 Tax=Tunturiibacter lichenicola TaxID=2051959 RepID=A0A852VB47_9BACT|nr:TlpA disulfide reductase family protein [Edaphobacter lichenicola]NYF90123.1 peroxiredoxin [Edaphobacter lichenicola]